MKFNKKIFYKTFLLAFLTFGVLSAIILTSLYVDANTIDPLNEETTVLLGITNNDKVLSLCVVNFDVQNNTVSFLPIPDNVWVDNSAVLQNQYTKRNTSNLISSLEKLIGTKINRYMLFSIDSLIKLNDQMGQFSMIAPYQFEHNGEMKSGTLNMNGELLKSMFAYSGYDMTQASISNIGFTYLKTFLATFAKPTHLPKLTEQLSNKSFLKSTHTNFDKKEIKMYSDLISNISLMSQKTVQLSGKFDIQPYSSSYFIPDNPQPNKNIFK